MTKPYRPCVVGVFLRSDGKVLVAKRSDNGAWQFPQGGVDAGESFLKALFREMEEELGVSDFSVITQSSDSIRYDFPDELQAPIALNFKGQEQVWFLCVLGTNAHPSLDRASTPEFSELRWESVNFVLDEIVDWKRGSYEKGLEELGLLEVLEGEV